MFNVSDVVKFGKTLKIILFFVVIGVVNMVIARLLCMDEIESKKNELLKEMSDINMKKNELLKEMSDINMEIKGIEESYTVINLKE